MKLKLRKLSVNLPFGLGGADIEITEGQAKAAWALYVEMATRIVTQELKKGEGSVREALSSIKSLFDTVRAVLRETGPDAVNGHDSVGPIAIKILNEGVRPKLVKWHTSLREFEVGQTDPIDETKWKDYDAFYKELGEFREEMKSYLDILAEIAGIKQSE